MYVHILIQNRKQIDSCCMYVSFNFTFKMTRKICHKNRKKPEGLHQTTFFIFLPKPKKEEYHKKGNVLFVQSQQI